MRFKKAGGRIFGVELNSAERAAFDKAVKDEVLRVESQLDKDRDSAILWTLHVKFGFGAKRLKKFWLEMYKSTHELREFYELPQSDGGWVARYELKKIGVDIDEWYKIY